MSAVDIYDEFWAAVGPHALANWRAVRASQEAPVATVGDDAMGERRPG